MGRACTDLLVLNTAQQDETGVFKQEVEAGLSSSPKTLPSRFFYDEHGTELFRSITRLPEYYLTAAEIEILTTHGAEIISLTGAKEFNLVEFGPGDGSKAAHLIQSVIDCNLRFTYLPIDVSSRAMAVLSDFLARRTPGVEVRGIIGEYRAGLDWISNHLTGPKLVLFLGSNLGNFKMRSAEEFVKTLRQALAPGDLLVIGLDLRKDLETMIRAYNDAQGITAQFNLNLLQRINRELGGEFNPRSFRYYSTFQPDTGGIESYLISLSRQSVRVRELHRSFQFESGEPIHTEHSHKYTEAEIARLASEAGFAIEADFYDSHRYFVDSVWRVPA